jgi:hypothetical protein
MGHQFLGQDQQRNEEMRPKVAPIRVTSARSCPGGSGQIAFGPTHTPPGAATGLGLGQGDHAGRQQPAGLASKDKSRRRDQDGPRPSLVWEVSAAA